MTGRRSHGRLSALNGVVHQGSSDIAARILEYLEKKDSRTRKSLEISMREAMKTGHQGKVDRKSFQSEWEKIIKGIEL